VTDDQHTQTIQKPNNIHTTIPYNHYAENHIQRDLSSIPTTDKYNCGRRLKGSAVVREIRTPPIAKKRPQDQTVEEWLVDYG
jgi:hypothetical protein